MAHVYTEESNFENIANAIREKNGTDNTYAPNEMASAIEGINTLQGLDFSEIYDQEQANGINQYYKNGIAYAEQIKAENPNPSGNWFEKFYNDNKLIYMPSIDMSNVTSIQKTWSGCQNLEYLPEIKSLLATNLNNSCSFCVSLKGAVRFDTVNVDRMSQIFYNCVNIEEIYLTTVDKCSTFSGAFQVSIYGTTAKTKIVHFEKWKQADISLQYYSLLEPESIHYIIQNAMNILEDGATARTLTLHATAKTNWQNSEYYEQDLAVLEQKGITIA